MRRLALFVVLASCIAAPPPSRELCYQEAERRAQIRAHVECNGDLNGCPTTYDIVRELERDLETCE